MNISSDGLFFVFPKQLLQFFSFAVNYLLLLACYIFPISEFTLQKQVNLIYTRVYQVIHIAFGTCCLCSGGGCCQAIVSY